MGTQTLHFWLSQNKHDDSEMSPLFWRNNQIWGWRWVPPHKKKHRNIETYKYIQMQKYVSNTNSRPDMW